MKFYKWFILTGLALFLAACVGGNSLTREELKRQDNSSQIVSEILFENDLDQNASYNIRRDGYVVIKFDESVSPVTYTSVVNELRSNTSIPGVRAEQSGLEVCPIRR